MKFENIHQTLKNPIVTGNVPLHEVLQDLATSERARKIEIFINLAGIGKERNNSADAILMFQILWSSILEEVDVPMVGPDHNQCKNVQFQGLTQIEYMDLDKALHRYADACEKILTRQIMAKEPNMKVVEAAAYEMLCAANMMTSSQTAARYFTRFLHDLFGECMLCTEWWKKEAPTALPRIMFKSIKEIPEREKQDRIKNLSKYLLLAEGYKQNVTGHQQDILINLVMDVIVAVIARKEPVPARQAYLSRAETRSQEVVPA